MVPWKPKYVYGWLQVHSNNEPTGGEKFSLWYLKDWSYNIAAADQINKNGLGNSMNLIIINWLSMNINNLLTNLHHRCQYTAIHELHSNKITKYEKNISVEILEKRGSNHIPIWENSESFKWDW